MPKVFNKRTDTIPPDAIYVGRPSKWGNPYRVGSTDTLLIRRSRKEVIDLYRAHLILSGLFHDLEELRGKDLVCWCAPLPCHADVLLELANKD